MSLTQPVDRIPSVKNGALLRIGDATYDPALRVIYARGEEMSLEPKVGELLLRLAESNGPVSREELLDEIWGDEGSDEALTQAVSKLRRAIGDASRPYRVIKTAPRFGYELDKSVLERMRAETATGEPGVAKMQRSSHFERRREFYFGVLCGAALVIVGLAVYTILNPPMRLEQEVICAEGASPADCTTTTSTMPRGD
jgi:DNA-binding winged helix-turn-helix (wHTH) protein